MSRARKRSGESGYALLLVFLMAAVLAISLYREIPRVAFESQRHKEQLLMERGQQYMRAIQVYQQTNKGQWPRDLDALETGQNRHYLRHRYIDPMTGKDDWRLIHTNGVALTDSLVTKSPTTNTNQNTPSTEGSYVGVYAGIGQSLPTDQGPHEAGPARRPSEGGGGAGGLPPLPGDQSGSATIPGTTPDNPSNGAANTPGQGTQAGIPGAPAVPGMPAMPGMPGSTPTGQTAPGQNAPGMPGMPGLTGQGGNPALSMINNILTNPNPQAAQMAAQGAFGAAPTTLGGGLAGVASKSEYEGIMTYNSQTVYKKWEFVFDPTKIAPIGGSGTAAGTPVSEIAAQQQGQAGAGGLSGMMGGGSSSMMGGAQAMQTPGAGFGASGFGTSSTTGGSATPAGTPTTPGGAQGGLGTATMPPGFRPGTP